MWQELIAFLTIVSIVVYSVQIIKNHKQLYILLFVTLVLTASLSFWLEPYTHYPADCHCDEPDYDFDAASEAKAFNALLFLICLAVWVGLIIGGMIKAIKLYYYFYICPLILGILFTAIAFGLLSSYLVN